MSWRDRWREHSAHESHESEHRAKRKCTCSYRPFTWTDRTEWWDELEPHRPCRADDWDDSAASNLIRNNLRTGPAASAEGGPARGKVTWMAW